MAGHAAIPGRSRRPVKRGRPTGPARSAGPAGTTERTGAARRLRGIVPAVLGVVYGFYASFLARDAGPITGWNVVFGILCAVVLAALCLLLGRVQGALIPLVRASAYGTLFGVALGFLHSLAGNTILESAVVGLALAAGMAAATFYIFYTRE
ncbi:hypothetical protein AS594_16960 [Streptomyces agglomeratus]|uniref:Uncharacterized protein n=1 Tax=Streptomyces agglomeratus TaxID=285458 RepID=A0A1E5P8W4_9ACTN|nr:hypothetical protein [Streptomyces agglomeratus]OEJ25935.1 hypothetical protein AS594_16960 [Streptomyces agglomeratus]OEJ52559.1 hypothetical protein BGK72_19065 [Streptomyces agglomeratus]